VCSQGFWFNVNPLLTDLLCKTNTIPILMHQMRISTTIKGLMWRLRISQFHPVAFHHTCKHLLMYQYLYIDKDLCVWHFCNINSVIKIIQS
jgi:hypothetical protein